MTDIRQYLAAQNAILPKQGGAKRDVRLGASFPIHGLVFANNDKAFWQLRASDFSGTATLEIEWYADSGAVGTVEWVVQLAAVTPSVDDIDPTTKAFGADNLQSTSHLGGEAKRPHRTIITLANADALAGGDVVWLQLRRGAGGTLSGDVVFLGATLKYTQATEPPPPPPPGTIEEITTQTFVNDSGSAQSNVPLQFGIVLKPGDLNPATHQLAIVDSGVEITPAQFDEISLWENGTIRHAVCSIILPSIEAGASKTLIIGRKPGQYSASAARTIADIQAHDYRIELRDVWDNTDAVYNGGSFYFAVNDYVATAARRRKYATGPVRDGWVIEGAFKRTGDNVPDEHLWGKVWIDVWTAPGGGVLGQAVVWSAWLPWMDVAGATGLTYRAKVLDGALEIRDFYPPSASKDFAPSDVDVTNNWITIPNHGFARKQTFRITTTGTAPAPLDPGVVLCCLTPSSSRLQPISAPTFRTDGALSITSQGTGTHTLHPVILHTYRAAIFFQGSDGRPDWFGVAAPTVRLKLTTAEKTYWIESGVMPPIDLSKNPSAASATPYVPGTAGNIRAAISSTGGTDHIAVIPTWCVRAFLHQSKEGLQAARVNLLHAMGIYLMGVQQKNDAGSLRIPAMNNGPGGGGVPYPDLGPLRTTRWWFSSSNKSADVVNALTPDRSIFYEQTSADGSHWPNVGFYPYVIEGHRHQLEAIWASANRHLIGCSPAVGNDTSGRNQVLNGVNYYGLQLEPGQGFQHRSHAWTIREVLIGACMGGSENPEQAYFKDVLKDNLAYILAKWARRGTIYNTYGYIAPGFQGMVHPIWMSYFNMFSHCWIASMFRTADAWALPNHSHKWVKAYGENQVMGSVRHAQTYFHLVLRKYPGAQDPDAYAAPADCGLLIGANFATDGTITLTSGFWDPNNYAFTPGDRARGSTYLGNETIPAEINNDKIYFIRNWNAATKSFQLSETPDGPIITFSQAYNNNRIAVLPQTGIVGDISSNDYLESGLAAAKWFKALGYDLDTAVANWSALTNTVLNFPLGDAISVMTDQH